MDAAKLQQLKDEFPALRKLEDLKGDWQVDLHGLQQIKIEKIDRIFLRWRAPAEHFTVYLHLGGHLLWTPARDGMRLAPIDGLSHPELIVENLQKMEAFVLEESVEGQILHILKPPDPRLDVRSLVEAYG